MKERSAFTQKERASAESGKSVERAQQEMKRSYADCYFKDCYFPSIPILVLAVVAQESMIQLLLRLTSAETRVFASHEPADLPPRPRQNLDETRSLRG
jgi:hypothetical protein